MKFTTKKSCIISCPNRLPNRARGNFVYPDIKNERSLSNVMKCANKIQNIRKGSLQIVFVDTNNLGSIQTNIPDYIRRPINSF